MNKRLIAAVLAVIMVCGLGGVGTMAWFTSRAVSSDNEFNTGTLEITAGDSTGLIPNFTISDMQPSFYYPDDDPDNDPEYAYDPVIGRFILRNSGSLPAKVYRMTVENVRDLTDRNNGVKASLNDLMHNVYVVVKALGYTPAEGPYVEDDILYVGTLYNMAYDNGGYFDPFVFMNHGDQRDIEFAVALASSADDSYQQTGLKMDFRIHANQKEAPITENETQPTTYTTLYNDPNSNKLRLDAREGYHYAIDHNDEWLFLDDVNEHQGFTGNAYEFRFYDEKGLLPAMKSMMLELKHESDNTKQTEITRVLLWFNVTKEDDKVTVENIDLADVDYKDIIGESDKYIYISKNAIDSEWKLIEVRATYNWANNTSDSTGWVPYSVNNVQ